MFLERAIGLPIF
ncbi:hypothetical protein LINPERHAP2_LOCUS40359 [Linum perenne]